MSARTEIIVNGKFFAASLEGMPRVGREICRAFDDLLDEPGYRHLAIRIAVPRRLAPLPAFRNIAVDRVGRFKGLLWEQIDLPLYLRGRYCLNFTNTAAVCRRNGGVVIHDAQFMSSKASHHAKSRLLYGTITPAVARRYRTIVTVSDFARRELLAHGVCRRDDIHVIANGADHVRRIAVDPRQLERFGLVPGGYALSNAYVHAHKNIRILFEAGGWNDRDRRLVLFGSSTREEHAARGIAVPPGVTFIGRVDDAALVALMAGARMFLFPSLTEGFGLPPLEAMTLGCPTVCAAAGAMPENCGDAVLYADPHDAAGWRDRIDLLWRDPAAGRRLAAAGVARAEGFRWSVAARAYLDLIAAELGVAAPDPIAVPPRAALRSA